MVGVAIDDRINPRIKERRYGAAMNSQSRWVYGCAGLLALAACSGDPIKETDDGVGQAPAIIPQLAMADVSIKDTSSVRLVEDLSPAEVASLIEGANARLIDVRTKEEFAQSHIPGAENIVLSEFDPAAVIASDDRPIVLYCRSGRRSAQALALLEAAGIGGAAHLEGGILAWQRAGYAVKTP